MDFDSVKGLRNELEQELLKLKADPVGDLPSIVQVVQVEVNRLTDLMGTMDSNDTHTDVDGIMMIERVLNDLELKTASSMEDLMKKLMDELDVLNFCDQLPRTASFILMVAHRLQQKISKIRVAENPYFASAPSANQGSKRASVDDPQSQAGGSSSPVDHQNKRPKIASSSVDISQVVADSSGPAKISFRKYLEMITARAIKIAMHVETRGLHDMVFEIMRDSYTFGRYMDNESVRKFITEKCNEAIEKRQKKLGPSNQGNDCPKQD